VTATVTVTVQLYRK